MHKYDIYGLCVRSQYLLPGMECESDSNGVPTDIVITGSGNCGIDKEMADDPVIGEQKAYDPLIIAETRRYLVLTYADTWRLYVSKCGNAIVVDERFQNIADCLHGILHFGIPLSLLYRGIVPLHAAAFSINETTTAIMADTGVGKSTMLWNAIKHSAFLVTDDVLPVEVQNGICVGYPSVSIQSKLSQFSLDYFGIECKGKEKVQTTSDKYWVHVPRTRRTTAKQVVSDIYILEPYVDHARTGHSFITLSTSEQKAKRVLRHIQALYVLPLAQQRLVYAQLNEICRHINVSLVQYRKALESIDQIVGDMLSPKLVS